MYVKKMQLLIISHSHQKKCTLRERLDGELRVQLCALWCRSQIWIESQPKYHNELQRELKHEYIEMGSMKLVGEQ